LDNWNQNQRLRRRIVNSIKELLELKQGNLRLLPQFLVNDFVMLDLKYIPF
jgi:hypothetical protein